MRSRFDLEASAKEIWTRNEWVPDLSLFSGLPGNYASLAVQWVLLACVFLLAMQPPLGPVFFVLIAILWLPKQIQTIRKLRTSEAERVANRIDENQKLKEAREQLTNDR